MGQTADINSVVGNWNPATGRFEAAEDADASARRIAEIRQRQRLQVRAAAGVVAAGAVMIIPPRGGFLARLGRRLGRLRGLPR